MDHQHLCWLCEKPFECEEPGCDGSEQVATWMGPLDLWACPSCPWPDDNRNLRMLEAYAAGERA